MIIKELNLKNFRRFDEFSIDFHERLTVIAARNGQGKTTILEGVALALGPFIGSFANSASKHIEKSDARFKRVGERGENEQIFPVEVSAVSLDLDLEWKLALNTAKSRTTTKEVKPISDYGKRLSMSIKAGESVILPVVGYYGSSRQWISRKLMSKRAILTESRFAGYRDCLSSTSNFSHIQKWMRKATYSSLQESQFEGNEKSKLSEGLIGISEAVQELLKEEGWRNFHYNITLEELAMYHDDHGILPVSLLSDGVRAAISLVADLALRCTRLNSPFGKDAPKQTPGIVLIDEVDLHLHPAWQQRILKSLLEAFPKVQFIVTTHSPQVVSTVSKESIRVILCDQSDDDSELRFRAETPSYQTEGVASSDVLSWVFAVDPVPDINPAMQLSKYNALVQQGMQGSEVAKRQKAFLENHYGYEHPTILELNRLIRLQDMKSRISQKKKPSSPE